MGMEFDREKLPMIVDRLLLSDFEKGKAIQTATREAGLNMTLSFAVCYSIGRTDGRKDQKDRAHAAYQRIEPLKEEVNRLNAELVLLKKETTAPETIISSYMNLIGEIVQQDDPVMIRALAEMVNAGKRISALLMEQIDTPTETEETEEIPAMEEMEEQNDAE